MIENLAGNKTYTKPKTEILPLSGDAFEYLTKTRKLRSDTISAYRLGCNNKGEIVIPFYDESDNLVLIKRRHPKGEKLIRKIQNDEGKWVEVERKSDCEKGGKGVLFGSHLCQPSEGPLVICFGDYDAMSVSQEGVPNVVSLPFGDKGFQFIDHQWKFLESFSEIILFPDNDTLNSEAEKAANKKLDELASRLGKYKTKIVDRSLMKDAKDPNEVLIKYGEINSQILESAIWFPSGIVSVADYFESEFDEGTPIGLPDADRAMGGIGGGQLIVVSGDNGAGKTTEVLNIVAKFIEFSLPVFIWSGEQKVGKIRYWFERIVAGRMNLKRITSPKTGFDYYFPIDDCLDLIRHWYRGFLFQYIEVGIDAEKFFQTAELAVRRHGCRLIVIDNLMAFTGGEGDSYYQAQGDFAESCKRFAEKWDVPVILVCHNKKPSEAAKPKIPTKDDIEGSKKITNWADVVIQMFRVPETFKADFENADTIFRICKSRESGILEDIRLEFDSEANRFCQLSERNNDRQMGWEKYL